MRYLSRRSDHLGGLAAALRDLGGARALLHELVQNADDSGTASMVRFEFTDAGLTVWNDGVFTDCGAQDEAECPLKMHGELGCDLHSFRTFAGGNKSGDAATTGAFGVGFTSVYRVTDHPELITNGVHLRLDEAAPEAQRIAVCPGCDRSHDLPGTTFDLPWARADSVLRRRLQVQPLTDENISALYTAVDEHAPDALLFLRRVTTLEVVSGGRARRVERLVDGQYVLTTDGESSTDWLILHGDFAQEAERLRAASAGLIEAGRSAEVRLAVPVGHSVSGRLYAGLPTETATGWSAHVDATFYPRTDRKGVLLDDDYRSRWNRAAVSAAANAFAANLEAIFETVGAPRTWEMLLEVERTASRVSEKSVDPAFGAFWVSVHGVVADTPIATVIDGTVRAPRGLLLPLDQDEYGASAVLAELGLPVLSADLHHLASQTAYNLTYAMSRLVPRHLVEALQAAGVTEPWTPGSGRLTADQVGAILRLLDRLLSRPGQLSQISGLADVAIVPCTDDRFVPAQAALVAGAGEEELFRRVLPQLPVVDRPRLEEQCPRLLEVCPDLDVASALRLLADVPRDRLVGAARELIAWFDGRRAELETSEEARNALSALPLFPAGGGLRPLTDLALPGFEDPVRVAAIVDLHQVAGHLDLLRLLGARELSVRDYLGKHVAPLVVDGRLAPAALDAVVGVVAQQLPALVDEPELRVQLARLPLVVCSDGVARPAGGVHFDTATIRVLDPSAPVLATTDMATSVVDAYRWLGVAETPRPAALVSAAERLAHEDGDPAPEVAAMLLQVLTDMPNVAEHLAGAELRALTELAWLPVEGGGRAAPGRVYGTFRRYLFASQGPMLGLSLSLQRRYAEVLRGLGVQAEPPARLVAAHLLRCAESGEPVHQDVYDFLGHVDDEAVLGQLRTAACVQVAPGEYLSAGDVYWLPQALGRWARHLDAGLRRYGSFFERLGVKDEPDTDDIVRLLERVSGAVRHDVVDVDDAAVVDRCWRLLAAALERTPETAEPLLRTLASVPSITDPRGLLARPEDLFFRDGRGVSDKLQLMSHNTIDRERGVWRAHAVAGVRHAMDVIQTLPEEGAGTTDLTLATRLRERREQLLRVVEGSSTQDDADVDLDRLATVRVLVMQELRVRYRVALWGQVETSAVEAAHALYLPDEHVVLRSVPPHWPALARELARVVAPGGDPMVLAPSIAAVLSAESVEEAAGELDELGVPRLAESVVVDVASATVTHEDLGSTSTAGAEDAAGPSGDVVSDVGASGRVADVDASQPGTTRAPTGAPASQSGDLPPDGDGAPPTGQAGDGVAGDQPGQSSAGGADAAGDRGPQRESASRKPGGTSSPSKQASHSRLLSYVSLGGPAREPMVGDESEDNSVVDHAGIRRVVALEEAAGRHPVVMDHSNPGYDVESYDEVGTLVRRIEVKSTAGAWGKRGVLLSRRQYQEAQQGEAEFWLYVVEYAADDARARVHRLCNPVTAIDYYGFDGNWRAVSETDG